MSKDTSNPAFPAPISFNASGEWLDGPHPGMTLRQWYAGLAMQGLQAQPDERTFPAAGAQTFDEWQAEIIAKDAKWCVQVADALIAALEDKPE